MENNSDFYYQGYKLTIENAQGLQRIANLSSVKKEFGIACSLNILAAEEAIKAIFILIKYFNPTLQIEDFAQVFRNHKVKHEHIIGFITVYDIHMSRLEKMIKNVDLSFLNDLPDFNRKAEIENTYSHILQAKEDLKKYNKRKITVQEIISWIEKANEFKNNGFYVDVTEKIG